ncbi:MAG TPA: endonuclease [Thiopseudomonas sp.]|nr:endonuclease [Thiopseudomonas sp.]
MFSRFIKSNFIVLSLALFFSSTVFGAAPTTFSQAKSALKKQIYFDQNKNGALGTLYCGCDWEWVGRSGGRVDHNSCGYKVRAQQTRAERTEWEHIVVASSLGRQLQCWQNGGRKNCQSTSPQFNEMEANLFNLSPVIGEVNGDRSNYNMGIVSNAKDGMYGHCQSKTDFKQRVFEPRDEVKGIVARTYFYMYDRYPNLKMSKQQQKLFMAWGKQFPVTGWERERERRISKIMGHRNDFVTGEQTWTLGYKGRGGGLVKAAGLGEMGTTQPGTNAANHAFIIHGNKRSRIYHLSICPSYNAMKASNIVEFKSEKEAQGSGYRKAGNCP